MESAVKHTIPYLLNIDPAITKNKQARPKQTWSFYVSIFQALTKKMEHRIANNVHTKTREDHDFTAEMLTHLRVGIYYFFAETKPTPSGFNCMFYEHCAKVCRGRGVLRKHLEWHVRLIEENFMSLIGIPDEGDESNTEDAQSQDQA